ncbi:MAG: Sporulation protein [Gemmatimonadetes bacterium]|nr:Sporulation protein [Gemmatimonadota bacterium]
MLAIRVPQKGGIARVMRVPKYDSLLWQSGDPAPAVDRILAFDSDAGLLAYVDQKGLPARIDFRLGGAGNASRAKLTSLSSADGTSIYGIGADGAIVRLTPSGDWSFKPPRAARAVWAQHDGSLIVLVGRNQEANLYRMRPPDTRLLDTLRFDVEWHGQTVTTGDRLYFVVDSGLVGIRSRTMEWITPLSLTATVTDAVATPSGDRIYVATQASAVVQVFDRYQNKVVQRIELPGVTRDLRMDPVGRYLLARPERGDSAWIVAVGTDRVIGSVSTDWRSDLPLVSPDGSVLVAQGADVAAIDGETLTHRADIVGGAKDSWYAFTWNGFRPRDKRLDLPVQFDTNPPAVAIDTSVHDSTASATDSTGSAKPAARAPAATAPTRAGWTVSFAAVLDEAKARDLASQIRVGGVAPRVLQTNRDGATIWRVVLGPYPTRDEAEKVGKDSGRAYWVYEGQP